MSEANNHQTSPTGAGLIQFLDFAIRKGYLKTATGAALKTASKEVLLATEGEGWEQVDVTALDTEDVTRRFETLRAMKFSTDSLNTYKSRFLKAVQMFIAFQANPGAWRPDVKQRSRTTRVAADTNGVVDSPTAPPTSSASLPVERAAPPHHGPNVITYPFPIRDGVLASLQLPSDLTMREAKRLGAFIESLSVDSE